MKKKQAEPLVSRHLHAVGARYGLPIGGNFEITARCNFSCPMCYVHLTPEEISARGRELTAEEWISIAREARDRGMMFALLTGGEPFVRADFFEIYHAMKEMGLLVSINSNASMIRGKILEQLLEDPPFRINITLYGGCRETYRNMCGQDMFEQVLENIKALTDAGVDVRLNCSVTPYNCQDQERILELSRELNLHVKMGTYMYPPIRINETLCGKGNRLSPEQAALHQVKWNRSTLTAEEFALRAERMKSFQQVEQWECAVDPSSEGITCRAGSSSFWMTWDGKMYACGMMPSPVAKPLEIGFDAAWEHIRTQTQAIRMPDACNRCPKRKVCSVCAATCVTETGGYDRAPEYICRMTDEMIRLTCEMGQEEEKTDGD